MAFQKLREGDEIRVADRIGLADHALTEKNIGGNWRVSLRILHYFILYSLNRTYFFSASPNAKYGEASRDASPSPNELANENPVEPPGPKGTGFETPNP
jgi:hypothetical protein